MLQTAEETAKTPRTPRTKILSMLLKQTVLIVAMVCAVSFLALWLYIKLQAGQDDPRPLPPLYDNAARVEQKLVTRTDGEKARVATFTTEDTPNKVLDYYREYMQRVGWEFVQGEGGTPGTYTFQYWPIDGPHYIVLISARPGEQGNTGVKIEMGSIGTGWYGGELTYDSK